MKKHRSAGQVTNMETRKEQVDEVRGYVESMHDTVKDLDVNLGTEGRSDSLNSSALATFPETMYLRTMPTHREGHSKVTKPQTMRYGLHYLQY
jgi:hypothetical protein